MPGLVDLWLPILLATVFVFIASSVLHMCVPIHKNDHQKLPGEDELLAAMREKGVKQGSYMFPFCNDMKEMGSEAHSAKMNAGPVGFMAVMPSGPMNMGKSLGQWFAYSLVMSLMVAYVGSMGLHVGEGFMLVFRMTCATALIGYGIPGFIDSIWKGQPWPVGAKFFFDGLVYALVTGATFGWLWPA